MRVELITSNGVRNTLNVEKIVAIDGEPFNLMTPVTIQGLHQRLKIIEEAFTGLSDNVAALAAAILPTSDEPPQALSGENSNG